MFICGRCYKVAPPNLKPSRLVVQTREKVYTNLLYDSKGKPLLDRDGNHVTKTSQGTEIVKELYLCDKCNG